MRRVLSSKRRNGARVAKDARPAGHWSTRLRGLTGHWRWVLGFWPASVPGSNVHPCLAVLLSLTLFLGVALLLNLSYRLATGDARRPPDQGALIEPPGRSPPLAPMGAVTPALAPGTIPGLPLEGCPNVLHDGGFETGDGWKIMDTAYSAAYVTRLSGYVSDPVRTGHGALRLGITEGSDVYSYSSAEQAVTVPAEATAVRLSFWVYLQSTDTEGDAQYLLLIDAKGGYRSLLWELTNAPGWQRREVSLDDCRGQRVAVHFEVRNDGDGAPTGMYVDDVTLALCTEEASTPFPTAPPADGPPAPASGQ